MKRVAVATDGSETARRAMGWAASMAERFGAELLLVRVVMPENAPGTEAGDAEATRASVAAAELASEAAELAGARGRARVVLDAEPAAAIARIAEEERADVLVVGNAGMSGRKEFLLGNVPNRISHTSACTVVIVNTFDGELPALAPRPAATEPAEEPLLMPRAAQIGRVLAKHSVKELFGRRRGDQEETARSSARRLRAALEELGPTFCKLGQVLSTRPDLLPAAFVEELATLQDHVPPMSEREVVSVMEQELRVPWEDVFESIEPAPLAAGTIAQVHRATLTGGDRVVVKVQRPTARDEIMRDLGLLELFALKTGARPAFRRVIDAPAIVEHLSASLRRELDFRQEAGNIERMKGVLEPYSRLGVPRVYTELSSDRLLVMEEIQGGPIRQAPPGAIRKEAARQLLESYYRQVLTDGFFHADPHPGNLMWWNDRIYFLDFGMVGEVPPDLRQNLTLLLLAFWQEDVSFLTDVTLMISGERQPPDLDVSEFQREIGDLMARHRHQSLSDIQLGPILQSMTEISIRHELPLPSALALTAKALAQVQLATAELDPDLDPFAVAGSFLARDLLGRVRGGADPRKLFYNAQKLVVRFGRLAESIERLTGARPGPKLQVHFRGTERLEESVRRAGRRLSLSFAAAGCLIAAATATIAGHAAPWVPITLGGVGGLFSAGLIVDILRRR
ncbi:MAG: universal stress protein [Acidobacteria bacterium]|nr:universal stress protein [Acidobacteriota bacterium]